MKERWNYIYHENIKLDSIYNEKYLDLDDIHEKNCIELIIELGEFINETKCFKYWTVKEPNIDNVYEEAADVIGMILCLYNHYKIDEVCKSKIKLTDNLIYEINKLFNDMTKILENGNENISKCIFTRFMHICELLNLNEDRLLKECERKIKINIERLKTNY